MLFVCLCCVPTLCIHTSIDICINAATPLLILGVHAQRGLRQLSCVSVRLSVRYSTSHFTSHESLHKRYQVFSVGYRSKLCGVFSETAGFGSYGVKHGRKIQLLIKTGLSRAGHLALCILKAQRMVCINSRMLYIYCLQHPVSGYPRGRPTAKFKIL